ncbi:glucose-6-phosphate isomerase [Solibacillus isronensis]|uniref:glucose-6-phosphate isomerase n=1 Tax=Solibacillus isronensis TaxID=412383 RepID=UPI00203B88F0|nr:glucose-6-phosphate isomerase [Solibacillus isronensis]MCM3722093.1 glucose-6-phosphate isomerase [Solibacillus isronensis]
MQLQLLKTHILNYDLTNIDWQHYTKKVEVLHDYLHRTDHNTTGWMDSPLEDQNALFAQIHEVATEIKLKADILIVVGIGGSYLGARAVQNALTPHFIERKSGIEVVYVGQNMSGAYVQGLIDYIKDKRVYVNVISKSGGTMEPALAFRVFRQYMEDKYGVEAKNRIIVTTDAETGILRDIANSSGYRQFEIPANVGGRYSVLTPVGLLPLAVAGIDIDALMIGAKSAATEFSASHLEDNEAYRYAVLRHALHTQGYKVELLASFEPALKRFHEWWMQLFGESEGKEAKGLFPTSANFSTDLHSIGQFIQEGSPILFETLLHFKEINVDYKVPFDPRDEDGLNYLAGHTFNEINAVSKEGTALAHSEGGVPVIQLELDKLDEFHLGYLIYFFMKACAMSALLLEVNPFDQPGVEAYKKKIMELLKQEKVTE